MTTVVLVDAASRKPISSCIRPRGGCTGCVAFSSQLALRGDRLVVVLHGVDHYDPPTTGAAGDSLAACLPHALPASASVPCVSGRVILTPRAWLRATVSWCRSISMTGPAPPTTRRRSRRSGVTMRRPLRFDPHVGYPRAFLTRPWRKGPGTCSMPLQLRKQLAALPQGSPARRQPIERMPAGIRALIAMSWERVAVESTVMTGLRSPVPRQ